MYRYSQECIAIQYSELRYICILLHPYILIIHIRVGAFGEKINRFKNQEMVRQFVKLL